MINWEGIFWASLWCTQQWAADGGSGRRRLWKCFRSRGFTGVPETFISEQVRLCACVRLHMDVCLSIFASGQVSRPVLVSQGIWDDNDIQTHWQRRWRGNPVHPGKGLASASLDTSRPDRFGCPLMEVRLRDFNQKHLKLTFVWQGYHCNVTFFWHTIKYTDI